GAAGGDVVGVGHRGGVVGGAVVDGDRLAAAVGQADGEVIAGGAAVRSEEHTSELQSRGQRVGGLVRAHNMAVGDGGVDRCVDVDDVGLGWFELGVAPDLEGHPLALHDALPIYGAAGGDVVGVGHRGGVVGGAVVDGDRLAAGVGQADGEVIAGGAAV